MIEYLEVEKVKIINYSLLNYLKYFQEKLRKNLYLMFETLHKICYYYVED